MKRYFIVYGAKRSTPLDKLWRSMTGTEQFAAEYAVNFLESDGYNIKDLSDDDLELYAWKGCSLVGEGNAEPEYEDEEWYEDEADCNKVFDYLVAKRDNSYVSGSTSIKASDGERIDNDWLLKPGNKWYAVSCFYDYGDVESGPIVDGDWEVYQAPSPEIAQALCKRDYPRNMISEVRLATPDEIEEYYYILGEGDAPDHIDSTESGSKYSYGGLAIGEDDL